MPADRAQIAAALSESIVIAVRDLGRIADRINHAQKRLEDEAETLEVYGAAALVNGYYSHLERAFDRIVRDLSSAPPEGPDWHRRLLLSMTAERSGVRPAIIDVELSERLAELLAFRHLFRNLYVLDLRPQRIAELCMLTADIHPRVIDCLTAFQKFLSDVANAS